MDQCMVDADLQPLGSAGEGVVTCQKIPADPIGIDLLRFETNSYAMFWTKEERQAKIDSIDGSNMFKFSLTAETQGFVMNQYGQWKPQTIYVAAWCTGNDIASKVNSAVFNVNDPHRANCRIVYEDEGNTGHADWIYNGICIRPIKFLISTVPHRMIHAGEPILLDYKY